MLKVLNTKILIAILAVLTAIAGAVVYQKEQAKKAADAAAKAAAILQQQQDEAEAQKRHAMEFQKQVEEKKKASKAFNKGGSKTWQNYVP